MTGWNATAEHLKPALAALAALAVLAALAALAAVAAAAPPCCTHNGGELKSLAAMFRERVPEYRDRKRCTYPVHTPLGIMAAAHLADAPRGQKDLEVFTRCLSQHQRKAPGVRRDPKARRFHSPDQTTFSRLIAVNLGSPPPPATQTGHGTAAASRPNNLPSADRLRGR